jgi:thioredoxin 1
MAPLELFDFYADWCEPCKILDTILEEVSGVMHNTLKINKIDIEAAPDQKALYGISSVPVLILKKGGRVVWRMNGFLTAPELIRVFRSHLD